MRSRTASAFSTALCIDIIPFTLAIQTGSLFPALLLLLMLVWVSTVLYSLLEGLVILESRGQQGDLERGWFGSLGKVDQQQPTAYRNEPRKRQCCVPLLSNV